ncbi:MAG: glycosyl hydrolase family 18 protein [Francisellaceae bacterium]
MKLKKITKLIIAGSIAISTASFAADKPFFMAYFPNYVGYANMNFVADTVSEAGRYIPIQSYVIPGVTMGYPAYDQKDKNQQYDPDKPTIAHQPTQNNNFTETIKHLSALAYGFFQPQEDGTFKFNDSWADFKNSDLDGSDSLCGSDTADELKICYRDGKPPFTGGGSSDQQCWGNVCYGNFDAFLAANNDDNNLKHYISVGGWTYRDIMDQLVAKNGKINDDNIANLIKTVSYFASQKVQGIDLDIEFSDSSTDWQNSLLFKALADNDLISKLKATGLNVAITIQANPTMLKGIVANGWINSWFKQGLNHLNIMTYDFHGNFDGQGNKTGFNSSLFVPLGASGLIIDFVYPYTKSNRLSSAA